MADTITLKPCPFCGGVAEFERLGDRRQSCVVACTDCGARLESSDEGTRSGFAWNERAALLPADARERVMKALAVKGGCGVTGTCDVPCDNCWRCYDEEADAVLTALGAKP